MFVSLQFAEALSGNPKQCKIFWVYIRRTTTRQQDVG